MPVFTELNDLTARAYANALAAIYGLTVVELIGKTLEETVAFRLSDGTRADVWLQDGYVYGEA
jgi:hypothetical protein